MKRQPTTQQVTWFLDLARNNQLDLDPPYQRKSVWSAKDRKFFLDTVFRNYPAPPVFIHRSVDDNGYTKYHVVDGKQRLETILLFFTNKVAMGSDFGDTNLNGLRFKDLLPEYKRKFWDYTLVVDFIDSIDGKNIEEVFDRVNRNARNLQPQELRHARYNGWFINASEIESEKEFWWNYKISTRGRDKRMKNVQFISELLLVILEDEIVGFSQDYLDEMHAKYDDIEELAETGEFDEEYFEQKVRELKMLLEEISGRSAIVKSFISNSNTNFYTLWSYLYFNPIEDIDSFSRRLEEFIKLVSNADELLEAGNVLDNNVLRYYHNSRGAATDFHPRQERLISLSNAMN